MTKNSSRQKEVILHLKESFSGLSEQESWGETVLFYNPDHVLAKGVYFCTIKDHDGPGDKSSGLDRDEIFRLSFALPEDIYLEQFGPRPSRPAKGQVVSGRWDFQKTNALGPHPIYAWMCWVQILSPSDDKIKRLHSFLKESHNLAACKYQKRLTSKERKKRQCP